mgnify:CR=1 FL=1
MSIQHRRAVLFIHGILGTPNHFAPFVPLVPSGWSICNIKLKGHCGGVKDFSRATMAEWKSQVQYALAELLKEHDRIIIAAHSMGTLFAIQEAIKNPVAELFLLNVPLRIRVTPQLFQTAWKIWWEKNDPDDERLLAAQTAYSIERDRHILRYFGWLPRYLELFAEIRETRKLVEKLSVPSHIYFSVQDEMVSPKSHMLLEDNAFVTVKTLKKSGHFYYSPDDRSLLIEDFREMIQNADVLGEH